MTDIEIPVPSVPRGIWVNRTLNLRSIRAIGYDMDYTLVHYRPEAWEARAFEHGKAGLAALGWPVGDFAFDPSQVIRGLVMDLELGNLVKATRFGWVIRAAHGTQVLDYDKLRQAYAETMVDLGEDRFEFMNTLFSLSEASLFAQAVDLLDAGAIPDPLGYAEVYYAVRDAIDSAHQEGMLKDEILADPERFIELDEDIILALRDQQNAGKRLMLITNSDWEYAQQIMEYSFDRFLPDGQSWRTLFDTVIVSAAKPDFFTSNNPLYKVVDEEQALLAPHRGAIEPGEVFFGGNARLVEKSLGLSGDEILYVGDHLFGDVHFSKALLRWRTALILRELEAEVDAMLAFLPQQEELDILMARKAEVEAQVAALRVAAQRTRIGYAPPAVAVPDTAGALESVRDELARLDQAITPLAIAAGRIRNEAWGPLMRAGQDKSLFARQVERYADVYTSRVSNLLYPSPFAMLRAARLDLPHDPHLTHFPFLRG